MTVWGAEIKGQFLYISEKILAPKGFSVQENTAENNMVTKTNVASASVLNANVPRKMIREC